MGYFIIESIQEITCVEVCHGGVWFRAVFRVLGSDRSRSGGGMTSIEKAVVGIVCAFHLVFAATAVLV